MDRFLHVTGKIKTEVIFVSCRIFSNLFRTQMCEIPWQNGNWFCKMWEWTTALWNNDRALKHVVQSHRQGARLPSPPTTTQACHNPNGRTKAEGHLVTSSLLQPQPGSHSRSISNPKLNDPKFLPSHCTFAHLHCTVLLKPSQALGPFGLINTGAAPATPWNSYHAVHVGKCCTAS